MDKIYKLQLIIFFISINFAFVSCWNIDFKERENSFKQKELYGIVFEKYRDKWNHNVPMLRYHNKFSANNELGISEWMYSDLWDFIEIGDSIHKEIGSLDLEVIKANKKVIKVYKFSETK